MTEESTRTPVATLQRIPAQEGFLEGCDAPTAQVSARRYRVAVVFPRAQPYFCKFFQRLAAHPEIDLTVYFYSDVGRDGKLDPGYQIPLDWDVEMWSGFRYRVPPNRSLWPDLSRPLGTFHPELLAELSPRSYDMVVMQRWWSLTTWLALPILLLRRIPILMYSDKSTFDWGKGLRRSLRNRLLRGLFRRTRAFLTVGRRNAEFYRSLGVPDVKMFPTPLAVDNEFFCAERRRLLPERNSLRGERGIPEDAVVILTLGRLVPLKGVDHLISAFARLRDNRVHLLIAGDGPLRKELEALVRTRNTTGVHFAGFQNYSQIPACYAVSDVFVLPSYRESWGVVINEAMNFALPVVASRDGGAVGDLVENGANGLLFDYGDVKQLADHLEFLVTHPEERRRMGEESARRVADWNFDQGVEGFFSALRFVGREAGLRLNGPGA